MKLNRGEILLSLYKNLSDDMLAGFFVEISKNIEGGILSDAMQYEIRLILKEAKKENFQSLNYKRFIKRKY